MLRHYFIGIIAFSTTLLFGQGKDPSASTQRKSELTQSGNNNLSTSLGYDKTRWGMQRDQIKSIYPDVVEVSGETDSRLRRKITVKEIPFTVDFIFNETRLYRVKVAPAEAADSKKDANTRIKEIKSIAASLKDALISKYGLATIREGECDTWYTPNMKIEFIVSQSETSLMTIQLTYSNRISEPGL